MLIVDSHLDIAYNALEWDRDLLQPIVKIREAEAGMAQKGRGLNVVNFAELRRGGIGLFFVTMGCRLASMGKRFPGVRTQDIAYAKCKGELAYYRLMEAKGSLAPDTRSDRTRRPSGRVGRRSAGDSAGVCSQHGRGGRHCGTRTGGRVVG